MAERLLPGTKSNATPRATIALRQPVAAFTLYTTAQDYGHFLATLLRDQTMLAQTLESSVDVDPRLNLHWGLGWGIQQVGNNVHLWHWGNNPGYRAFALASASSGDGLVLLTNSDGGLKLAEPLVRAVLPGKHRLFRSPILEGNFIDTLCDAVRVCF